VPPGEVELDLCTAIGDGDLEKPLASSDPWAMAPGGVPELGGSEGFLRVKLTWRRAPDFDTGACALASSLPIPGWFMSFPSTLLCPCDFSPVWLVVFISFEVVCVTPVLGSFLAGSFLVWLTDPFLTGGVADLALDLLLVI
jgi:hypothetical protein